MQLLNVQLFSVFIEFEMAGNKLMNVDDALLYLENLDVSSSDDEDLGGDDEYISRGELMIVPPENHGDGETDEDSGDENEMNANKLNRNQLLANANVTLNTTVSNVSIHCGNDDESPTNDIMPLFDVGNTQQVANITSTPLSKKPRLAKKTQKLLQYGGTSTARKESNSINGKNQVQNLMKILVPIKSLSYFLLMRKCNGYASNQQIMRDKKEIIHLR